MDSRNIKSGSKIPVAGYCDQPYIVKTDDGAWLLTVTTGSGAEGAPGQHVVSMRSFDKGASWVDITDVSPVDFPESSYSVIYKTTYGRIYCFYNFNADNTREVLADDPPFKGGYCKRVDTQGHFVFRYSDDNGKSWSDKWYDIPIRRFEVDRLNPYGGEIMFFWNVGKPLEIDGEVFIPLYKIRKFGIDFMRYSEGALLNCPNINSEKTPEKLVWNTLPEGDVGIRAPHDVSVVSEEHSFVELSDGSVFCVFRTVSGHPYCSYSRDKGRSFSPPEPLTYPNGRAFKHPRAANFIWKCENGKYIYWFHNHGGKWYDDRNPAWLCGAEEYTAEDGQRLRFFQPIPVLYDDDTMIRMSYPDLVEDNGEYYITETQKNVARVHHIDKNLIESLWTQGKSLPEGIAITDKMPSLKPFTLRDHSYPDGRSKSTEFSFTLRFSYEFNNSEVIFSTMNGGKGMELSWNSSKKQLELLIGDGQRFNLFINDDILLEESGRHKIAIAFDGGVRAVYFVTDGVFCDGGNKRDFGFTRIDRGFLSVAGLETPIVNKIKDLMFYEGLYLY
jgi:hypothetical protein